MDPELMDDICVCPGDCDDGKVVIARRTDGTIISMDCFRCDGQGMVNREDIQKGEDCFSVLDQRGQVVVNITEG